MINLLKNAAESGSPPRTSRSPCESREAGGDGSSIEVADRGTGLTDTVLRDALLPFYSTKRPAPASGSRCAARSSRRTAAA